MKLLRYIANSWGNLGTIALLSKAWERYVIDRKRFRSGIYRTVPDIAIRCAIPSENQKVVASEAGRPLRICYLTHCFFPDKSGGTERFVLNLAKEQQRAGNDVRIITLGKRDIHCYHHRVQNILYENFEYEGLPVTQLRYQRTPRGLYYDAFLDEEPSMAAFAQIILDEYHFDLIHAAYPQPFAAFLKVCRMQKVPYLVTTTDFNVMCHYSTLVNKSGQFCISSNKGAQCRKDCKTYGLKDPLKRYQKASELLWGAGYITAPSEFVARVLAPEFDKLPILVVPHGISKDFHPTCNRIQTRRFVYAGTLSGLKGVHLLLEAFHKISGNDLILDIYGDGDAKYISQLKALAKGDSRIVFHGGISNSEIAQVYQNSDCVIVPSIWFETYNFVLREALACGCLVVASEIGAMPEAMAEGRNGFLFPVGNVTALQEAIEKAIGFDWNLYLQASFPRISDEAARYEALYRKLLTGEKFHAENQRHYSGI